MADSRKNRAAASALPERAIRMELDRVLASSAFANADRLRAFLSYVTEESLAGRAHLIAGKTIAQDVYGRAPDDGSDSIVRVDAGRLRRRLSEYYEDEGAGDPTRVYIDSGGYAPRFQSVEPVAQDPASNPVAPVAAHRPLGDLPRLVVAVLALALVVLAATLVLRGQTAPPVVGPKDHAARNQLERTAFAQKSTAALQAANLAEQASGLLFPIADVTHQKLATAMYRDAMQIDPTSSEGYAGAAHSLGTLALLAPDAEMRDALLTEAESLADTAIDLNPRNGWSQSAAAWVAFVKGDYPRAVDLSRLAASLNGEDGKTLDFHGVILGMTGNFAESAEASDPSRPRNNKGRHPAHLNIYAVANFHLGNHETAIASINTAIQQGGPVSELTLMYKAAANQALGNTSAAMALLEELGASWPDFRPERAVKRFYQYPEHAAQVLTQLRAAGWSEEK
ncbi:tetratricopeptide repeat protein [Meridianimarinicoccus sp. MJW13]|uniref:tetratricopeptide repeat protein n=1 Tax=Meridianimarinicoccus sp. MJW13 TaxID=2720031 RepID=UPI00186728F2|nr:hypothetical protein [Fluviibacterium sp. MJW13]